MKNYIDRTVYTKEELENAIKLSKNMADVCRNLGLILGGGSYEFLKDKIKKFNINTSHFLSRKDYIQLYGIKKQNAIPLEKILIENSTFNNGNNIKEKLYKAGLKKRECEECGQGEVWRNKKLSLHLDHVNGNKTDNRIENLKILCPNCHATTKTYCRKKKKHKIQSKENIRINNLEFIKFIKEILNKNQEDICLWKKIMKECNYSEPYARKCEHKYNFLILNEDNLNIQFKMFKKIIT